MASDVLGPLCVWETAAKGPLVFLHCSLSPPLPSANKFHATLCEPSNFPNIVDLLFSSDISVAFQQPLWHKLGDQLSGNSLQSLVAHMSICWQKPQLSSKWFKCCQLHSVSLLFYHEFEEETSLIMFSRETLKTLVFIEVCKHMFKDSSLKVRE